MGCSSGKEAAPSAAKPAAAPAGAASPSKSRKKSLAPTRAEGSASPKAASPRRRSVTPQLGKITPAVGSGGKAVLGTPPAKHHQDPVALKLEDLPAPAAPAAPKKRPPVPAVNFGDIAKEAADRNMNGVDDNILAEYDLCTPGFDLVDGEEYDKAFSKFMEFVKKRDSEALGGEVNLVALLGLSVMYGLGGDAWSRLTENSAQEISERQKASSEFWLKKRLEDCPDTAAAALLALSELDRVSQPPKHAPNHHVYLAMAAPTPHPLAALRHVTDLLQSMRSKDKSAEKKKEDDIEKRVCLHLMGRVSDHAHTRAGAKAGRYVWKYYEKGAEGFDRDLRKAERILEYGIKYEVGPLRELEQGLDRVREKIAEEEPVVIEEVHSDCESVCSGASAAESAYGSGPEAEQRRAEKAKRKADRAERRQKRREAREAAEAAGMSPRGRRPSLMRQDSMQGGGGGSMRGRRPSLMRQDSMQGGGLSRSGSLRKDGRDGSVSPRGGGGSRRGSMRRDQEDGSVTPRGGRRGSVSPRRGVTSHDADELDTPAPTTPRRGSVSPRRGGRGDDAASARGRGTVSSHDIDALDDVESPGMRRQGSVRREGSIRREGSVRKVGQRGNDIRSQLRQQASDL